MSDYTDVLLNTQTLISFPSVTPKDAGSHSWLIQALESLEYTTHEINHGDVKNFVAFPKNGVNSQTILFVGHTDVVPANDQEWTHPPFQPTIRNNTLYGRGTVDMKSSIAAMLSVVAESYMQNKNANIAFLITSNEEGETDFGVEYVLTHHKPLLKNINKVLIGEPTSDKFIGDTIKVGRRGSLNLLLKIHGQSGHVAYPKQCHNPIDVGLKLLKELNEHTWGEQYDNFDFSKMTVVSIKTNSDVFNATPSTCDIKINWRFNPTLSTISIKKEVDTLAAKFNNASFKIQPCWLNQGHPFFNESLEFANQIKKAISQNSKPPIFSTSGGTSDARFFPINEFEIVELGPRNHSAHKVDEHILVSELYELRDAYQKIVNANFI